MEKNESITALLVDCVNITYDLQTQELKKTVFSNLSVSEVHVLEAVSLEAKPTMTNVANRLRITIGSLTTAINKLIEKKMVMRSRSDADKRVVYLVLTQSGKKAVDVHNEIHASIDKIVMDCIPEEKMQWVCDTIKEISSRMQKMAK